jgi:excinuclease UvrABC ATPase subunit
VSDARIIRVTHAREHNLRGLTWTSRATSSWSSPACRAPGKSSLAFDTIFAEGQRKYMESLSAYARQFLDQLQKPDVESIEGLPPTIAIQQRSASHNPRSTVATTTEIYDYLRLLFARAGSADLLAHGTDGNASAASRSPPPPPRRSSTGSGSRSTTGTTRMMLCAPADPRQEGRSTAMTIEGPADARDSSARG